MAGFFLVVVKDLQAIYLGAELLVVCCESKNADFICYF